MRDTLTAGMSHTGFESYVVRSELTGLEDRLEHGSEVGAREAGMWRLQGEDYAARAGDVPTFCCSV